MRLAWPRTLRARLLVTLAALLVTGLAGGAVTATVALRGGLSSRLDDELTAIGARAQAQLAGRDAVIVPTTLVRAVAASRLSVLVVRPDGSPVALRSLEGLPTDADVEALRDGVGRLAADQVPAWASGLRDVHTPAGTFRVLTMPTSPGTIVRAGPADAPPTPAVAVLVGASRAADDETVSTLVRIELAVTAAVLLAVLAAAAALLRVELRPLSAMSAVAASVARGRSDERVPTRQPSLETARLARALNEAFDARGAAEARLRRFVADASHELRSPLTTIRGWADLYAQGALDDDATATAMARIEDEASRMAKLVEELLLLASLDEGVPLARDPVDLAELAADVVTDARVVAPDRSLTRTVPGPVVVTGDAARLRQVLTNLVGNALRHTPPDAAVRVAVGRLGDRARITVEDDGPGIPEADRPFLFDRFYRADPARRRQGTGLGLAVVRGIVEAHGGTVAVTGRDGGHGSVFEVLLPTAPSSGPSSGPPSGPGTGPAPDRPETFHPSSGPADSVTACRSDPASVPRYPTRPAPPGDAERPPPPGP